MSETKRKHCPACGWQEPHTSDGTYVNCPKCWEERGNVTRLGEAQAISALIRSGFSPEALTAALAAYEGGSK